jgi:hypothetical protein
MKLTQGRFGEVFPDRPFDVYPASGLNRIYLTLFYTRACFLYSLASKFGSAWKACGFICVLRDSSALPSLNF